jgi:hypothetical protein
MNEEVFILTGEKGSDKTTFFKSWRQNRDDVTCILTPVQDEKRFFYDISN